MSALSDLRADLDAIADRLDGYGYVGSMDAAELRHILDDRDILDAPTTAEIITHLNAGGTVKSWSALDGTWLDASNLDWWRERLADCGDQPQPGIRLGPLPPVTKRVRLDQLKGHAIVGHKSEVDELHQRGYGAWWARDADQHQWEPLDVADDGTVEVQA